MAAARVSISIWNSTILLNTPMLLPKLWTFPVLVLSQRSKLQVLPVLVVVLMPLMPLVMVLVAVVEVVVGKLVLLLMLHGPLSIWPIVSIGNCDYWVWTCFCLLCY